MDNLQLMAEADRRGILPPEKKTLFDEAVRRGLITAQPEAVNDVPRETPKQAFGVEPQGLDALSQQEFDDLPDLAGTARQVAQGATLGFADEGEAGIVALLSDKTYQQARDEIRQLNAEFAEKHPGTAITANLVGGALTGGAGIAKAVGSQVAKTGAKKIIAGTLTGAAEGAAAGAGFSDADNATDLAADTAVGALGGAALGAIGGGIGAYASSNAAKSARLKKAIQGEPDSRVVQAMVKGGEKAGASKALIDSSKQGFDDGVLHVVLGADRANKTMMKKMANVHEKALFNPVFARKNRASDVVGEVLEEEYKYLAQQRNVAGTAIDKASKEFAGVDVGHDAVIREFMDDLDLAGVSLGEKGLQFNASDFAAFPTSQSLIKKVFREAAKVDDALSAHKFKRTIDKLVFLGKQNKKSADADAINLVKSVRRDIDSLLDGFSPEYDQANINYKKAVEALGEVDALVGKSSGPDSPNFARSLGTLSNRVSSRAASGGRVDDAFNALDATAKELGGEFASDYNTLAVFADELDRMFGGTQQNSLQGQVRTGSRRLSKEGLRDAAIDKAVDVVNKVRGRNDDDAFRSIRLLLDES